MDAVVLTIQEKICPNDCHVCGVPNCANPELHCLFCGSMQHVFLSGVVIMCLGLNSLDIGAMRKFRQGKATDILIFHCPLKELLMSLCTQIDECPGVQEEMNARLNTQPVVITHKST